MSYFVKCSNLEYNSTNMLIQHFPDYNSALNFAEQKVEEGYSTTIHSGSTHVHVYPVDEQEESSTPDPVQPVDPNPVQPVDPVQPTNVPKNVIHLGIIEGENISDDDLVHNGDVLEKAAGDGESLYFPSGTYEFDRSVQWQSKKDIVIKGDGKSSKICQRNMGTRPGLFVFESCSNVSVSSLQLIGTNALGFVPDSASRAEYAIGCFQSKNVTVSDCDIWGWPTDKTIFFRDCWCVKVTNCLLYFNVSRGQDGADIYVQESKSPFEDGITRYIEITNNRLLSNNLGGVLCTSANSGLIVSNNTVVTCDENMVEIQSPALINRKEGIELHYTASDADGNNRDVHEAICANNLVKNTRWSGIYCNNAKENLTGPGGIKGSITGNTVINTCQEQKKYQAGNKRAGICIQQHQQLTISNNVIRGIGVDPTPGQEHSGMILECSTDKTANINATAIVSNNIITDVKGRGITVGKTGARYNIVNNIVQNCDKNFLLVYGSHGSAKAKLNINNNSFLNEIDNYSTSPMILISGGKDGDVNFTDNTVSSEDKPIFSNAAILFRCSLSDAKISSNRFIGPAKSYSNVRAIYLDVIKKNGRHQEMILKDNYIANVKYGIYGGGSPTNTSGPTIMEGTTWDNVTIKISGDSDDYIFEGKRNFDGRITIFSDSNPSKGTWLRGDERIVKNPSANSPYYFVCVKANSNGSGQWMSGALLKNR